MISQKEKGALFLTLKRKRDLIILSSLEIKKTLIKLERTLRNSILLILKTTINFL